MVLVIKRNSIFNFINFLPPSFFILNSKKDSEKQDQDEIGYLFKYSLGLILRMTETFSYKIFEILKSFVKVYCFFNQTLNIVKIPYRFLGSISDNILFVHLKKMIQKIAMILILYRI